MAKNNRFSVAFTLVVVICPFAYSCGIYETVKIESDIYDYYKVAETINIGDPKSKVLTRLPDQARGRPRESSIVAGKITESYYFRTARTPDGRTTDDEVVPYLFIDDKLHAIGWTAFRAFTNPK